MMVWGLAVLVMNGMGVNVMSVREACDERASRVIRRICDVYYMYICVGLMDDG